VLHYLADKNVDDVDEVGKLIVQYYENPDALMKTIGKSGR